MKDIIRKSEKVLSVEKEYGVRIEDLLRKLYVDDNLSEEKISQMLNLHINTIKKLLPKAGIYSHRLNIWS